MRGKFRTILVLLAGVAAVATMDVPVRGDEPVPTIAEVQARLPVRDWKGAAEVLGMLAKISDPKAAEAKSRLLRNAYESLNTPENDRALHRGGLAPMARRVQMRALAQLALMPTATCAPDVRVILTDYVRFMNRQAGPRRPRQSLQLSMAHLIRSHIGDAEVRAVAQVYLASAAMAEWTKARVATGLLQYQVAAITDAEDPDLSRRLALIMETACLPSLEQMLKAPKRLQLSAAIVADLTHKRPGTLLSFIAKSPQTSDAAKYFLAYACLTRALRKVQAKEALLEGDRRLVELAEQWHRELVAKTAAVKDGDQILDHQAKRWRDVQNQ